MIHTCALCGTHGEVLLKYRRMLDGKPTGEVVYYCREKADCARRVQQDTALRERLGTAKASELLYSQD